MITEPVKSKHYVLVMDEDRDKLLSIWMQCILEFPDTAKYFAAFVHAHGLVDAQKELMKEFNEKNHEMGWCQDPDCTFNKK